MNSGALCVIILSFSYFPVGATRLPAAGLIATDTPSRCFRFYLKAKHSNLALKQSMRLIRGNAGRCAVVPECTAPLHRDSAARLRLARSKQEVIDLCIT